MKAPKNLNAAGKRAWQVALLAIENNGPAGQAEEIAVGYAVAVHLAHKLRGEWERLGSPALEKGGATGKVWVAHPLIKAIQDAEREVLRFGTELGIGPQARKKLGAIKGRPQERVPKKGDEEEGRPSKVVPIRRSS